jgi:GPI mannosyltransferase 3
MMWYIYAGLPAICGIMLPFFLWEVGTVVNAFVPSPRMTLLKIIVPYIILHSFSEHKEFRFLLPMLPLICILAGHAITRLLSVAETSNSGLLRMITPKLILTILVLLNYPHLLYLGIIHQRGPVAVNQYIASTIQKSSDRNGESQQFAIHYLMGCHSTPMYSHLHLPNVRIQAWYLDCSPDCRSKPEIECESDAFSRDPFSFVESTYVAISIDGSCIEVDSVDDSCMDKNNDVKEPPSFLVVMQDDAKHIENVLREKLQMSHLASIRHTIKSVALHDSSANHDDTTITLFSMIDIHFDHIEVFIK